MFVEMVARSTSEVSLLIGAMTLLFLWAENWWIQVHRHDMSLIAAARRIVRKSIREVL